MLGDEMLVVVVDGRCWADGKAVERFEHARQFANGAACLRAAASLVAIEVEAVPLFVPGVGVGGRGSRTGFPCRPLERAAAHFLLDPPAGEWDRLLKAEADLEQAKARFQWATERAVGGDLVNMGDRLERARRLAQKLVRWGERVQDLRDEVCRTEDERAFRAWKREEIERRVERSWVYVEPFEQVKVAHVQSLYRDGRRTYYAVMNRPFGLVPMMWSMRRTDMRRMRGT